MRKYVLLPFLFCSILLNAQNHLSHSRMDVDAALAPFYHGVASGDPLSDRVILWTRITSANPSETIGWQIATDTGFTNIINSGTVTTDSSKDYTVKVDASGLQPGTWYYYRFNSNTIYSITGRTRTAPAGSVSNLRFAVVSCSNLQSGFFNGYRDIVNRNDVDAVIHLGDYYYEYGPSDFEPGEDTSRLHDPRKEVWTLSEYRIRHSSYKLDPDLRVVHQQFPFIAVWDDHESANNSWEGGAENHTEGVEDFWVNRKAASRKAYFEWMPIRDNYNSNDTIHRTLPFGDLADLIMIDTRLEGREIQAGTTGATVTDTNRTLLGHAQLDWFKQQLSNSTAKWKLIGNQVMIAPLVAFGNALNEDQWDGYPAERAKILRHLSSNNIDNVVVLTGDIHTSWANNVPHPDSAYNAGTGNGSACVEYVCTSITSGSFITFSVPGSLIPSVITHVKYAELSKRGYLVLDVTDQKVQGDWIYMNTIASRNFTSSVGASWCDMDGANRLNSCNALAPRGTNPPIAPIISGAGNVKRDDLVVISCFPNPWVDEVVVQYHLTQPADIEIRMTDMKGQMVYNRKLSHSESGLFGAKADLSQLAAGSYIITVVSGTNLYSKTVVKGR